MVAAVEREFDIAGEAPPEKRRRRDEQKAAAADAALAAAKAAGGQAHAEPSALPVDLGPAPEAPVAQENLIEARVQKIAAEVGVGVEQVRTFEADLRKLREDGFVVDLTCRGVTMFKGVVSLKKLGVPMPEGQDVRIGDPNMSWVTDEWVKRLTAPAGYARDQLNANSFMFTATKMFSPGFHYIPFTAWSVLRLALEKARGDQQQAVKDFCDGDGYDTSREKVLNAAQQLALESRARLEDWNTRHPDRIIEIPEDFVSAFVDDVEKRIPSRQRIRAELTIDLDVGHIPLTSDVLLEQVKAQEYQIALERNDATLAARATVMAEMVDVQRDIIREQVGRYVSPITEAMESVYGLMLDGAKAVEASLQQHGEVKATDMNAIRRMRETYKKLAGWLDMPDLKRAIDELTVHAHVAGQYGLAGSQDEVVASLRRVQQIALGQAKAAARPAETAMAGVEIV